MCLDNSSEETNLEQNEPFPTSKFWFAVEFLLKLTQQLQSNNVLDTVGSNLDGIPWRDTCVSST
jgi:hypothetical protein